MPAAPAARAGVGVRLAAVEDAGLAGLPAPGPGPVLAVELDGGPVIWQIGARRCEGQADVVEAEVRHRILGTHTWGSWPSRATMHRPFSFSAALIVDRVPLETPSQNATVTSEMKAIHSLRFLAALL